MARRAGVGRIDLVLCSSALRARQTWQATALDAPVRYLDELYGGGIEDIVEILAGTPADARTVLVLGHAPTIPATAHDLATIAHLARRCGRRRAGRVGRPAARIRPARFRRTRDP